MFNTTKVFSNPVSGTYNPESTGISFAATCIKRKFFLTSFGNYANNLAGVWIGGTPASCKISEHFHLSSLIKKLYLSYVKTPLSNIVFKPLGS